jgi:hypothetical protein
MLKALVWKEYREQLPVALAGLAISLILPFVVISMVAATMSAADPMDMADVLRFVLAVLVWPFFSAAMGATTFAGDARKANLGFLLSRPVSRGWIWLAKTMIGALAVAAVVGISWLISKAFDVLIVGDSFRPSMSGAMLSGSEEFVSANVLVLVGLTFVLSIFFGGMLDRPMTAAAAGLIGGLGLVMLTNAYWRMLGNFGRKADARIVLLTLGFFTAATLTVTLLAFARGQLLERREFRKRLISGAGIVFGLFLISTQAVLYAETRLSPSYALLSNPRVAPAGQGAIVEADRENARAPQVWRIDLEGRITRLTPRLTHLRGFSEDGESIIYESERGWLAFPSRGITLRTVRLDGSGDRPLTDETDRFRERWITSPDGRFLGRSEYERSRYSESGDRVFVIASPDGTEIERFSLREIGDPYDWAWLEDSSGILFNRGRRLTLTAYDLDSGEFFDRVQHPLASDRWAAWSRLPEPAGRHLRLSRRGSWRDGEVLWAVDDIDLETGDVSTIFEVSGAAGAGEGNWHCSEYVRLSSDRQRFFYTTCDPLPHAPTRTWRIHFHVVDLETDTDKLWTTIEGHISGRIWGNGGTNWTELGVGASVSDGGDRMLIQYRVPLTDPSRDLRPPIMWDWKKVSAIVEPDGSVIVLDEGWLGTEWIDPDTALVAYIPDALDPLLNFATAARRPFTRLAMFHVDTGELEVFFP